MQRLLLVKITLLLLALLAPQQVPGAATQPLPHSVTHSQSAEAVLRKLDVELRTLSLAMQQADRSGVSAQQLQQIEALWQQLFAISESPVLNKLYNQYQVQLQLALHGDKTDAPVLQASQISVLRQRLLTALTQVHQ
ncbi:hypothetical protein [Rheinheimera sp. F8]|uniref:hypothetical protein n=1 Tax=Rheinheimera sp. F8 TaxID=1763998 RepID=UPI0007448DCA|nr:hypothetical protein [Rheinheimera sp. F8]ALZ76905.1 hypothetical protein ATY27_14825 [Rheinheimera sp. F8]